MSKFRVYFQRSTSIRLYIDIEASSRDEARNKANEATKDSDDSLTYLPESYTFDICPTGEVVKL